MPRIGSSASRGYDRQWRKLRARHLAKPENQHCTCGCGLLALDGVPVDHPAKAVVDHIVPIAEAPERRLDPTNIQTMRKACHDSLKQQVERHGHHGAIGQDGNPVDPKHPWNR